MSTQLNGKRLRLNSAYTPHERVEFDVGGPSMTRQEFVDECDINAMMERMEKHGVWPMPPVDVEPQYLDLTSVPNNLMEVMDQLNEATAAFMALPAKVRKEFDNDAVKFVEFACDPANLDRMREFELAPPKAEPVVAAAAPAPAAAPAGAPPAAPGA